MSYLDGWQLATIKLDAKCGKGWKSGAGSKCVRNKISKKKVALGAVALGGLVATGAAAMMMGKKKKGTGKEEGEKKGEEPYERTKWFNWEDVAEEYDKEIEENQARDPNFKKPTFREASEYYNKKIEEYSDESKWTDPGEGQRNLTRWAKERDEFYEKARSLYHKRTEW